MYLLTAYQSKGDKNWVAKIVDDFNYEFLQSEWTEHKYFIGWKKSLFSVNEFYAFHTEKKTKYFNIEFDENNEIKIIYLQRTEVEEAVSELRDPFIEIEMKSIEFLKRSIDPYGKVWLKWYESKSMVDLRIYENETYYKVVGMMDERTEQYTKSFQVKKDFGTKTINKTTLLHKQKTQYRLFDINERIIVNSLEDILERNNSENRTRRCPITSLHCHYQNV